MTSVNVEIREDVATGYTFIKKGTGKPRKQRQERASRLLTMETAMNLPSRAHHIVCPFCESGELLSFGASFARCRSCGLPLLGSTLETLRDVIGLPDALGAHPCECGHPEMRELPDGVFHCPACGSKVLPIEARSSLPGSPAGIIEGYSDLLASDMQAKP